MWVLRSRAPRAGRSAPRLQDRFTHERALLFVEPGHRRKRVFARLDGRENAESAPMVTTARVFSFSADVFFLADVRVFRSRFFRDAQLFASPSASAARSRRCRARERTRGPACAWSFRGFVLSSSDVHEFSVRPSRLEFIFFMSVDRQVTPRSSPKRRRPADASSSPSFDVRVARGLRASAPPPASLAFCGARRGQRPVGLWNAAARSFSAKRREVRRRIRHVQSANVERFVPELALASASRSATLARRCGGPRSASPGDHARNHAGGLGAGRGVRAFRRSRLCRGFGAPSVGPATEGGPTRRGSPGRGVGEGRVPARVRLAISTHAIGLLGSPALFLEAAGRGNARLLEAR